MSGNGILLRPFSMALASGGGGKIPAIAFNNPSAAAMGGILTNQARVNLTTANRGIDGFSFDLMIPTGVEGSIGLITDNAGNATSIYHRVVSGESQFVASGPMTITGINLADGFWHHIEFIKNASSFNYVVVVDGVTYTTSTNSSATRQFDSIGIGNGSIVAPNQGVKIRNFQSIYNRVPFLDYPFNEGEGDPIDLVSSVAATLEDATIEWSTGAGIARVANPLLFRSASIYNHVFWDTGFSLMSNANSYLEFDYLVQTPGTYNVLVSLDGVTSTNRDALYVQSNAPSTIKLVTSSGTTRTLDTTVDLLDGSNHKIKFEYISGLNLGVYIDDVFRGNIGNSSMGVVKALGGRAGNFSNNAQNWTIGNIKYFDGTTLMVDCAATDGLGRILRNAVDGQDDLVVAGVEFTWTDLPVPVEDIGSDPDVPPIPPEPEPDEPPVLVTSPQSSTESVGFFHTLTAVFTGSNLTYQWYENGVAMPGETSDSLELLLNSSMNKNSYYCRASNEGNYADSNAAILTLRPRIYMNWDITVPEIMTTGKIYLTFRDDGSISYYSDTHQVNEDWCDSARDGKLNFNMSDYEVQLQSASGEAIIDPTSGVTGVFTQMYSGITLILDVTQVPLDESRNFNVKVRDTVMPGYNWAGWDNDTLFYRREA